LNFGLQVVEEGVFKGMEFGVVTVYTCSSSCGGEGYHLEYAYVQLLNLDL